MVFLLHVLRPGDIFVDAGANIGAYSLLASGLAGAQSIAFEPFPPAADHFQQNISLNKLDNRIELHRIGLGAKKKSIQLTSEKGIQNHIVTTSQSINSIDIELDSLDQICADQIPLLIKIDVEGYETAVIEGGKKLLENKGVKALIIETMGLGTRFGYKEDLLHDQLLSMGFGLYSYNVNERTFSALDRPLFGNNLYLKDMAFIQSRIKEAGITRVHGVRL